MLEKTFLELKRNCKNNMCGLQPYKLALLGDCATQHLSMALRGYAYEREVALSVWNADYDQIDAQLLDPKSEMFLYGPDGVLLFMCVQRLYKDFLDMPESLRASFAENTLLKIGNYWKAARQHGCSTLLQYNFPYMDDGVFGNYACRLPGAFPYQLRKLNYLLGEAAEKEGVFLIDLDGLQSRVGADSFADKKLYYMAKMPIAVDALPKVAAITVDVICALMGKLKKCIVLDLDNTIWGGIIGDDGIEGIELGEIGRGPAFVDFQNWLKQLKERGILLAVCSKNNEDIAKQPFISHPDMVLRLEDISAFIANWEDKAQNIRKIQQVLNIGMDSIVFLDDNPFERDLVKNLIPEVTVPQLPDDPAEYLPCLRGLNLFETASYSAADSDRTAQYRAEAERAKLECQTSSYEEYLQGLEMAAEAKPFDSFHFPRIAQLTQRSNQFNLRTIRYSDAEIAHIAHDRKYITRYFKLADKFGDHGLIGVVILERWERGLFIDTWLMSCRVLKRGMEEFIADKIFEIAAAEGAGLVIGEYIPTPKNAMVADMYSNLGFSPLGDGRYEASVRQYKNHKYYIKEKLI